LPSIIRNIKKQKQSYARKLPVGEEFLWLGAVETRPPITAQKTARKYNISASLGHCNQPELHTEAEAGSQKSVCIFAWKLRVVSGTGENMSVYKILGFHGGDYEECRLLGCDAVHLL
jgi:hypothetical protein